jgi:hypothetical protein
MSDEPNADELARRYLDLWQEQMKALASDPEYADMLERLSGMMGGGAWNDLMAHAADPAESGPARANAWAGGPWSLWPAAMMAMMSGGGSYGRFHGGANGEAAEAGTDRGHTEGRANGAGGNGRAGPRDAGGGTAAGSASTADASRRRADDLDELAVRMAALEERLASMESALRGDGGAAKPRAAKRRS